MTRRTISVFGSSAPQPGSLPFVQAQRVGELLAEAGFAVVTGGYAGTMTAVSQGAYEAGGHVIGVTCDQIEQFRPIGPNRWVNEEIRYPTLRERLLHLVTQSDGLVVLPGGIGTLSEMTLAWSFLQVGEVQPQPLVLLGELWRQTIHTFYSPEYVRAKDLALLLYADDAETAVAHIVNYFKR
jgi:uncharacterized protein (TIGR00730 family)